MYPDEISCHFDDHHESNDMIIVPRFECYSTSEDSKWYLQIPGILSTFTRDTLKQLKKYLHFCDPSVAVPAVNDPAFDRLTAQN